MKILHKAVALLCMLAFSQFLYAQTPPTPVDLVAQVKLDANPSVQLSWHVPAPTTMFLFFKVYRSVDDTVHFKLLNVTNRLNYEDVWVISGHTYYYYVSSSLVSGLTILESPRSNIASATINPTPPRPQGVISGTVVDSLTRKPLSFTRILFFPTSKTILWIPQAMTDSVGRYRAVLDTGTYIINAQPGMIYMSASVLPPYQPEWYKDSPDPRHATPVKVLDNSQFTADFDLVRFVLPVPATISGTVTDTAGHPLSRATVVIMRTMQEMFRLGATSGNIPGMGMETINLDGLGHFRGVLWTGVTDSAGKYHARVLTGNAYIAMAAKQGYLPQYFDHKSNPMDADIIRLTRDTSGINFSLSARLVLQNSISGVVRDSNGVRVPSRIVLFPLRPQPMPSALRFEHTDSLGAYKITNVKPGKYFVLAIPFSTYAPAFYKAGAYGVFNWQKADTVNVPTSGNITGIDVGVVMIKSGGFAALSGTVASGGGSRDGITTGPVEGVSVLAKNALGDIVGYGITDDVGAYTIESLPAGRITIVVDREGYLPSQDVITIGSSEYTITRNYTITPLSLTSVPEGNVVPANYELGQNYPNPFNPSTRISFAVPAPSRVRVKVYNLLGQEIATLLNDVVPAGNHQVLWNGKDATGKPVASGIYFCRLEAASMAGGESFSSMKKMVLVK